MTRQAAKDFYEPQGGETVGYISALDAQSAIDITYNDFESADSGKVAKTGDTMTGVLGVYELDGGGYDITISNAPYVDVTGNLLVGSLNGSNGIVYVDNISSNNAGELKIGADTEVDGNVTVLGTPTADTHAVTKGWADEYKIAKYASFGVGENLNNLKDGGFYSGYNYTNGPVANVICTIIVLAYSPDWGTQIFVNHQSTGPRIWARSWSGTGGNTWSAWLRVEMI